MPTLLIRNPDGSQNEQELSGEITVGRADGNDLILSEGGVSRRHARFFLEGGQVMVEDLGSANGTWVDGEQISEPTAVGPRVQVVIGDYELAVKAGAPVRKSGPKAAVRAPSASAPATPPAATTARPAVRPARATRQLQASEAASLKQGGAKRIGPRAGAQTITGPTLRGLTGPWANKLYPIRGKLTVGRVPGVQVLIEDESVSRRHAEVERTADGVVVRDLNSANGTQVNGTRIEGEALIQPGDVVQFGMIELSYEVGDEAVLAAPTRRAGSGPRAAVGRGTSDGAADPAAAKRKKLLVVAAGLVGMLAVAGVVTKVQGPPAPGPVPPGPVVPQDPKLKIQGLLSECRSYASMELGTEPDWEKAEAACNAALDLDPIHPEATGLLKHVRLEKQAHGHYVDGERLMDLLREEEALDAFAKIPKESSYYQRVKPRAREAIAAVKKRAGNDCTQYVRGRHWEQALPRCERYMTFACQQMKPEDLQPPPGYEIDVKGNRPGRRGWRPRDAMYLNLLRARAELDPDAGPWMCPHVEMYQSDIDVVDPKADVKKVLRERYAEVMLYDAMLLYWDGAAGEANNKLLRLRATRDKAELHAVSDEIRRDIGAVENMFKTGASMLSNEDYEKAAENFRKALELDQKLMGELAERRPSFFRRTITADMAKETLQGGRHWADRQDFKRACNLWKLGFSFYRGNADLNRAVGFCSTRGGAALDGARTCSDLTDVLALAVDGDGLKQKVDARRAELNCP